MTCMYMYMYVSIRLIVYACLILYACIIFAHVSISVWVFTVNVVYFIVYFFNHSFIHSFCWQPSEMFIFSNV